MSLMAHFYRSPWCSDTAAIPARLFQMNTRFTSVEKATPRSAAESHHEPGPNAMLNLSRLWRFTANSRPRDAAITNGVIRNRHAYSDGDFTSVFPLFPCSFSQQARLDFSEQARQAEPLPDVICRRSRSFSQRSAALCQRLAIFRCIMRCSSDVEQRASSMHSAANSRNCFDEVSEIN
jgi:hypothetical protein